MEATKYFTPKVGSLLKIDPYHNLDPENHFLDAALHVKVNPPKGSCFSLSHISGIDIPDKHTCGNNPHRIMKQRPLLEKKNLPDRN